jgi:hypothetical protein
MASVSADGWDVVTGQLATLREWRSVYRRWWTHPGRADGDVVAPWTDADQARLDRLTAADPEQLDAAAARLAGEAVTLEHLVAPILEAGAHAGAAMAADAGVAVADRCADVASAVRAQAADLMALAHDLRRAAARLESWLVELVSLVRRAAGSGPGAAYPSLTSAHGDVDDADRRAPRDDGSAEPVRWPALDELVDRHGAMIRLVRAAMDEADPPGTRDGWCGDRGHGAGWPCVPGVWESGWPPPVPAVGQTLPDHDRAGGIVVDRAEQDRVLAVWQPLPITPRFPGLTDPSMIEPGVGPVLPGTEAGRVGTDTGIRISQLPDGPPAR